MLLGLLPLTKNAPSIFELFYLVVNALMNNSSTETQRYRSIAYSAGCLVLLYIRVRSLNLNNKACTLHL